MFRWIICFCLLLGFGRVQAHQPDLSSTILSEQGKNRWVLQVRAALTAFEYEIHQHYGEDAYTTPEEFQTLVVQHVQENISLLFDDDQHTAVLKNGTVKLGHETNAIFEVEGIPENFSMLKLSNSSFKDISRNQSALIIFKKGMIQKQFVLNNANQHMVHLEVQDSQFIALRSDIEKAMAMPSVYLGIALLGVLGLVVFLNARPSKVAD